MTWVHQTDTVHTCQPPMRSMSGFLPPIVQGATRAPYSWTTPAGEPGDLWRCPCRVLWRVANACDICDTYGGHTDGGMHSVGIKWRRAKLWTRICNWGRR